MTKHETLKEMCDLIGHKPKYMYDWVHYIDYSHMTDTGAFRVVDVREIIHTPEFRKAFITYYSDYMWYMYQSDAEDVFAIVIEWLDDPVTYLANLLWLWQKN